MVENLELGNLENLKTLETSKLDFEDIDFEKN